MSKLKIVSVAVSVALVCTMATACSQSGESDDPKTSATAEPGISVEEKIFDVEVTLPASFFEDMSAEEIQAKAVESGYKADVAADGTVTYTIPKPVHQKLMVDMATNLDESIAETLSSEGSIQDIVHDAKFANFKMTVDRASFENSMSAAFVPFSLGIGAMFYQAFDGVAQTDRRVVVAYIDGATGEEFNTYVLPDALE